MSKSFKNSIKNFSQNLLKPEDIDLTNDEMKVLIMKIMTTIKPLIEEVYTHKNQLNTINDFLNSIKRGNNKEGMLDDLNSSIEKNDVVNTEGGINSTKEIKNVVSIKLEDNKTKDDEKRVQVQGEGEEKGVEYYESITPFDDTSPSKETSSKVKQNIISYITVCSSAASSGISNFIEDNSQDSSGKKAALFGVEDDVQKIDKLFKSISSKNVKYINQGNFTFTIESVNTMPKEAFLNNIEQFFNSKQVNGCMIYYSGHGFRDASILLESSQGNFYIYYNDILNLWRKRNNPKANSQLMIILDCCFSGSWVTKLQEEGDFSDVCIQASCTEEQKSLDMGSGKGSLFTNAFIWANLVGKRFKEGSCPVPCDFDFNKIEKKEEKFTEQIPRAIGFSSTLYDLFRIKASNNNSWNEIESLNSKTRQWKNWRWNNNNNNNNINNTNNNTLNPENTTKISIKKINKSHLTLTDNEHLYSTYPHIIAKIKESNFKIQAEINPKTNSQTEKTLIDIQFNHSSIKDNKKGIFSLFNLKDTEKFEGFYINNKGKKPMRFKKHEEDCDFIIENLRNLIEEIEGKEDFRLLEKDVINEKIICLVDFICHMDKASLVLDYDCDNNEDVEGIDFYEEIDDLKIEKFGPSEINIKQTLSQTEYKKLTSYLSQNNTKVSSLKLKPSLEISSIQEILDNKQIKKVNLDISDCKDSKILENSIKLNYKQELKLIIPIKFNHIENKAGLFFENIGLSDSLIKIELVGFYSQYEHLLPNFSEIKSLREFSLCSYRLNQFNLSNGRTNIFDIMFEKFSVLTNLKSLSFINCGISKIKILNNNIENLDLSYNNFSNHNFNHILDNLLTLKRQYTVNLSGNMIDKVCFPRLKEFLKNNSQCKEFNLSNNGILDKDIPELIKLQTIQKTGVKCIDLSYTCVNTNEINNITELFKNDKKICSVNMSYCGLDNKRLIVFSKIFGTSCVNTISHLNLSNNKLSDLPSMKRVLDLLKKTKTLEYLNLNNTINIKVNKGGKYNLENFIFSSNLKEFHFDNNTYEINGEIGFELKTFVTLLVDQQDITLESLSLVNTSVEVNQVNLHALNLITLRVNDDMFSLLRLNSLENLMVNVISSNSNSNNSNSNSEGAMSCVDSIKESYVIKKLSSFEIDNSSVNKEINNNVGNNIDNTIVKEHDEVISEIEYMEKIKLLRLNQIKEIKEINKDNTQELQYDNNNYNNNDNNNNKREITIKNLIAKDIDYQGIEFLINSKKENNIKIINHEISLEKIYQQENNNNSNLNHEEIIEFLEDSKVIYNNNIILCDMNDNNNDIEKDKDKDKDNNNNNNNIINQLKSKNKRKEENKIKIFLKDEEELKELYKYLHNNNNNNINPHLMQLSDFLITKTPEDKITNNTKYLILNYNYFDINNFKNSSDFSKIEYLELNYLNIPDFFILLSEKIQFFSNLKCMVIKNSEINSKQINLLTSLLENVKQTLQELHLINTYIDSKDSKLLFKGLSKFPLLKKLNLSKNFFNKIFIKELINFLNENNNIDSLVLEECSFTKEILRMLFTLTEYNSLELLDISGLKLSESPVIKIKNDFSSCYINSSSFINFNNNFNHDYSINFLALDGLSITENINELNSVFRKLKVINYLKITKCQNKNSCYYHLKKILRNIIIGTIDFTDSQINKNNINDILEILNEKLINNNNSNSRNNSNSNSNKTFAQCFLKNICFNNCQINDFVFIELINFLWIKKEKAGLLHKICLDNNKLSINSLIYFKDFLKQDNNNIFNDIITLKNSFTADLNKENIKIHNFLTSYNEDLNELFTKDEEIELNVNNNNNKKDFSFKIGYDSSVVFPVIKDYDSIMQHNNIDQLYGHFGYLSTIKTINQNTIASGAWDNSIKIWDLKTKSCIASLKGHRHYITCIGVINKHTIISSSEKTLKIWDLNSNTCTVTLKEEHEGNIQSVVVINSQKAASAGEDWAIIIWDLNTHSMCFRLLGHKNEINCLGVLDEHIIASGSNDKEIKIWDLKSQLCVRTLTGHGNYITCMDVIDSRSIVSGSFDNNVMVWDCFGEESMMVATFVGHTDYVNCVGVVDLNSVLSGSNDRTLRLWDLKSKRCVVVLKGHIGLVTCLAVVNKNLVVSGSRDRQIKIWSIDGSGNSNALALPSNDDDDLYKIFKNQYNMNSNSKAEKITIHLTKSFKIFKYFKKYNYLITCGNRDLRIWDPLTKNCLATLSGHLGYINCVDVIDENQIISCSDDLKIKLWDVKTKSCITTFEGHSGHVTCIGVINPNVFISGSYDSTLKLWNINTKSCITTLNGHTGFVLSLIVVDENTILTGSRDKTIIIWDLESRSSTAVLKGHRDFVISLGVINKETIISGSWDKNIKLWDFNSKECVGTLEAHAHYITCVEIINESTIASGSWDKTIKTWDIKNQTCLVTIEAHTNYITSLGVLDENTLISGSEDHLLKQWDLKSNTCTETLEGHSDKVNAFELINEDTIITCSNDETIKITNLKSNKSISSLKESNFIISLGVIDENTIASCSNRGVSIWDIKNNTIISSLYGGHSKYLTCVGVIDNNTIVTCSEDKTLKVWDLMTKECKMTFEGHLGGVTSVAVVNRGRIISGSEDKTLIIWDLEGKGSSVGRLIGHNEKISSIGVIDENTIYSISKKEIKIWNLNFLICFKTFRTVDFYLQIIVDKKYNYQLFLKNDSSLVVYK